MDNQNKLPIGIIPEFLWKEKYPNPTYEDRMSRMAGLGGAIIRYAMAELNFPNEWVDEFNRLEKITDLNLPIEAKVTRDGNVIMVNLRAEKQMPPKRIINYGKLPKDFWFYAFGIVALCFGIIVLLKCIILASH